MAFDLYVSTCGTPDVSEIWKHTDRGHTWNTFLLHVTYYESGKMKWNINMNTIFQKTWQLQYQMFYRSYCIYLCKTILDIDRSPPSQYKILRKNNFITCPDKICRYKQLFSFATSLHMAILCLMNACLVKLPTTTCSLSFLHYCSLAPKHCVY
jgi:hypothetical protein